MIKLQSTVLIIRDNHWGRLSVAGLAALPYRRGDVLQKPGAWLSERLSDASFELLYSPEMDPVAPPLGVEQFSSPRESTSSIHSVSENDSQYNTLQLNGAALAQVLRDWWDSRGRKVSYYQPFKAGSGPNDQEWDFRRFVRNHKMLVECHCCSRGRERYAQYGDGSGCSCVWRNCRRLNVGSGPIYSMLYQDKRQN